MLVALELVSEIQSLLLLVASLVAQVAVGVRVVGAVGKLRVPSNRPLRCS